jgi:transposase InsO family protein
MYGFLQLFHKIVVGITCYLSTATHDSWMYPIFNKSDVFSCFVKFKTLVENLFSCRIKQFQYDNGGEYASTKFIDFLNSNGILHRLTCLYISQQNGMAKRKHQHIMEIGLTLLAQSWLPPSFWVNAFLTAIFLINHLPTPVLNHDSPYSKLFQRPPNYS